MPINGFACAKIESMNVQVELKISAVIEMMRARDCTGQVLLTGPTGDWRMRMAVIPWLMTPRVISTSYQSPLTHPVNIPAQTGARCPKQERWDIQSVTL
jgi:hypothetical protein